MFMTYSTSCYYFDNLRIHEVYVGMYVSFVSKLFDFVQLDRKNNSV